jgi:pimeloyl-ACP methyl ester carboxylesterase
MRANVLHDPPPDLVRAAVEATAASVLGRASARAIARITKRIIDREYVEALLPGVSQETLLIWGGEDRLLSPRWADSYLSLLRRATLRLVAGAGHMPMFEAPEEVAALIADFIER